MTVTAGAASNLKRVEGDGSTTEIPFSFRVLSTSDINIYKFARTSSTKGDALTTGFSISLNSGNVGGTVTFDTAPLSTEDVIIQNVLQLTQSARLPTETNFDETAIENALDRSRLIDIQQQQEIDQSIKINVEDPLNTNDFSGLFLKSETGRGGKVLKWNDDGDGIEAGASSSEIEDAATSAAAAAASATSAATQASNASTSASAASASAAAAASSAAEGLYSDVVSKSNGDSPIVPLLAEEGTLFRVDTSGGSVVVNLDELGNYGEDMKFAFVKVTGDANTITVNRGGSDTIEGGTSITITEQYETHVLVGDSATGTWLDVIQATSVADNSITLAKLEHGTQGDILYYGASGEPLRLAAGTFGQVLQTQGAGANPQWVNSPFSNSYESAEQTITSAGTLTLAHGLGAAPEFVQLRLVCKTAENGYSIGDVIIISPDNRIDNANGASTKIDATNITIRYGSATPAFHYLHGTTGAGTTLTNANWRLIVKAWSLSA